MGAVERNYKHGAADVQVVTKNQHTYDYTCKMTTSACR